MSQHLCASDLKCDVNRYIMPGGDTATPGFAVLIVSLCCAAIPVIVRGGNNPGDGARSSCYRSAKLMSIRVSAGTRGSSSIQSAHPSLVYAVVSHDEPVLNDVADFPVCTVGQFCYTLGTCVL